MESKTIFKEKDRVYVTSLGWGKVIDAGCSTLTGWVGIETDEGRIIHVDTYLVSFTEYTLEGFSQERPEQLPKPGDVVWGKGFQATDWSIGHYLGRQHASYKISSTPNALSYWLAFTITTKNPYENN
jgi:hypothetical protein